MKLSEIEKLINLYLDDQLSPQQQQPLQQAMQDDPQVARTVEQLKRTDGRIKQAVASMSDEADDSFEMIYAQSKDSLVIEPKLSRRLSPLRFVTGLAAGLVIGLAVQFMMTSAPEVSPVLPSQPRADAGLLVEAAPKPVLTTWDRPQATEPDIHEVDLYYFEDQQGRQWLVEGIRHEMVQQTSSGSI